MAHSCDGLYSAFVTQIDVHDPSAYGFRNFQNYRLRVRALCG